jgi:hypothetical protein
MSPHFYTTDEELDAAIAGVDEILRVSHPRRAMVDRPS